MGLIVIKITIMIKFVNGEFLRCKIMRDNIILKCRACGGPLADRHNE